MVVAVPGVVVVVGIIVVVGDMVDVDGARRVRHVGHVDPYLVTTGVDEPTT
jgi:hypothetical protein